jgi:sugar lactone lactonase YvrE
VVNWRTKEVSRLCPKDGSTVSSFTYAAFEEPIGLCVDRKGNIFVADNGARSVFVFDSDGNFKYVIKRDKFSLLGGVAVGPDDNTLVVADTSLFVINGAGPQFDKEIAVPGKGRFGGVCVDDSGMIIACRTEKSRSFLQVFKDNKLVSAIDSFSSKLRRPSDVALISTKNIIVVDLGNEVIKQYRYK